ncbi:MAG: T9SS type A sorting domain-containing protein [Bacteroidaceae bacterium]|nr:T9SS type A sorting domain-containing protein [Bacteroidaceae bacterium]
MKRKLLTLVLLAASAGMALAEDYNYLLLKRTDDSVIGVELRKARRITFTADALTLTTTDGEESVSLETLGSISFSDNLPTGIGRVPQGTLEPQRIVVYNVNGVVVRQLDSTDARTAVVNLNNLPAGVYIVKEGLQTRKWLKR